MAEKDNLLDHDAFEASLEGLYDTKAAECLNAVRTVLNYLDEERVDEQYCPSTMWTDKKGYSFETDIGYFWDGLYGLEECLMRRLHLNGIKEESHNA